MFNWVGRHSAGKHRYDEWGVYSMLINHGPFRRAALKPYIKRMSEPNARVVFDDHVAAVLEAQGFHWEVEPRSVFDPEQLYSALELYSPEHNLKMPFDEHLKYGLKVAWSIFSKKEETLNVLKGSGLIEALKLEKSSGLPMLTTKAQSLTYSLDREIQIRKGLKAPNPCVAYARTQVGGKTRLVWGYPLEMTIMEARFARPLIDHFLGVRTTMAFGMSKAGLGSHLDCNMKGYPFIYSLDYSKFDSSISSLLINESFRILSTWFSPQDKKELGWDTIVNYFLSTPIVMPDGNLYLGKRHGVPSGSYFTQLIDSIVNTALIFALSHRFGFKLKWRNLFVLGDDSIFPSDKALDLGEVRDFLLLYGIKLNIEKSAINSNHFLGAYWTKGLPDLDLQKIVNKAVYPERFRKYSKPDAEALGLLQSYSVSYRSAINLIPSYRQPNFEKAMWEVAANAIERVDMLTGSDKFLREEIILIRGDSWSPLPTRILK